MFSFGWSEIALTVIVVIIVVGPKEIPNLLKQIGSFSKSLKKNSAKLALNFVKNFKIVKFDYVSDVDTSILIYSQKHSVNVATCDKKLRKQLKDLYIRVISPHQNQLIVD